MRQPALVAAAAEIAHLDLDDAFAIGSGIVGRRNRAMPSYQPAPRPMAIAMARPPANVSPGYFSSIRKPSL